MPRLGAIGKHVSISLTERVIITLKNEWLKRVPIIKNFDHLTELCGEFESWYNVWRPHTKLQGLRPEDVYCHRKPKKPNRKSKTVPSNIEKHLFQQARVTGHRDYKTTDAVPLVIFFKETLRVYSAVVQWAHWPLANTLGVLTQMDRVHTPRATAPGPPWRSWGCFPLIGLPLGRIIISMVVKSDFLSVPGATFGAERFSLKGNRRSPRLS